MSPDLQRILVATDFSSSADVAWQFALDLASSHGAELTLLHVAMPVPSQAPHAALRDHQRRIADVQSQVAERVRRATTRRLSARGLVRSGETVSVILSTAAETGADLIVVGAHPVAVRTAVVIGSVAERLVRLAPCPVLVMKVRDPGASQAA